MTWQEQFNSGEVVYRDEQGLVLCGDCLKIVPQLPKATMIFADPPDNLGLKYDNYKDKIHNKDYVQNIAKWLAIVTDWGKIAWFSIYHKWLTDTLGQLSHWEKIGLMGNVSWRVFIWRFTFGQHNRHDCGNGFRPIIRIMHNDAVLYPGAIQEPSKRQTDYNDKRANPAGRVPDDFWEFNNPYAIVPLGGRNGGTTIISPEDADLVDLCSWSNDGGYVVGKYNSKKIKLHRIIAERMGLDLSLEVDHEDRNKLNNCRFNLRSATRTEQVRNSSLRCDNKAGHTGVCYNERDKKWTAKVQGKSLGYFNSKEEAIAARVAAANKLFGEFSPHKQGRNDSDVWEFPRVCGTFKERRTWHPNQHPEALIERIVKFSTKEGDLVIDMFAGTGTVHRVCRRLNRRCISIDISKFYCEKIAEEQRAGQKALFEVKQ